MIDPRTAAIHRLVAATGLPYEEMEARVDFLEKAEPSFDLQAEARKLGQLADVVEEVRKK